MGQRHPGHVAQVCLSLEVAAYTRCGAAAHRAVVIGLGHNEAACHRRGVANSTIHGRATGQICLIGNMSECGFKHRRHPIKGYGDTASSMTG